MEMKTEALKLADELRHCADGGYNQDASAMIRRLVEELDRQKKSNLDLIFDNTYTNRTIELLNEELDRNKIYIQKMEDALGCDVSYYEPLNKPLNPFAWVDSIGTFVTNSDYQELPEKLKEDMIPLYTTPQTKPLSDEEIKEVIRKHWNKEYGNRNMLTLCKAVLEEANK